MFSLINSIILRVRGSKTVANNEESILKSLFEFIQTTEVSLEIKVKIFANVNSDAPPLHQSMLEEVRHIQI